MRRRHILGGLLLSLVVPPVADAQQAGRLGMLLTGSSARPTPAIDAFLRRLADLGWVEGRTLVVERRWTEDPARLSALAAELVALKVNVILTPGAEATSTAKAATTSIPIVMLASTDPVAAGLVASLARPGGNLTGVTVAHPENATLVAEYGVKYRLPVMALFPTLVERGALISYGPNLPDLFLRAAAYVDKILRGAAPASLPIEQPRTFTLAINLKTAKALSLTIPPSLLLRADQVIE